MFYAWACIPVFLGATLLAQSSNGTRKDLPTDKVESIPSPNGRWVLVATPSETRTVTLVDKESQKRALIKEYDRSLQIGWSPDSSAFFLNDAYASNLEDAYVYFIAFGKPVLLNDYVLGHDSEAKSVAKKVDHAYFQVGNWTNAGTLLLEYCGHGGEAPGIQFDFIYKIDFRDFDSYAWRVEVKRVSRRLGPLSLPAPDCTF